MSQALARSMSVFVLTMGLGLVGCSERQDAGPPELHLGEDVCDFCSMIISDQAFAAACVIRQSDGRWHTAAFDDIGCLLAFDKTQHDPIEQRYVTDYNTGQWILASQATFIISPGIRSPMASGMIASQSTEGTAELAKRFNGTTSRYDDLEDTVGQDATGSRAFDVNATQAVPSGPTFPDQADATHEKPE